MRARVGAVLFVVLGGLALAASPAAAATSAKGSKPSKSSVIVLTSSQITAGALLGLTDMPTGYAADLADAAQNSQPNATTGLCNGPNGAARAQAAGVVGTGLTEFAQNATTGPYLSEGVSSFPSAKQAASFLTAITTGTSCNTWTDSSTGTAIAYTVAPIAYTKVGDQTTAFRITSTAAGSAPGSLTGSADAISVRIGNNVVQISYGGLAGSDATLEQQYVGKATTKLGAALAAAKTSSTKSKKKKKK